MSLRKTDHAVVRIGLGAGRRCRSGESSRPASCGARSAVSTTVGPSAPGPATGPSRSRRRGGSARAARRVVLGPFSFLLLSKGLDRPLDALDELVPVYETLLRELAAAGANEVQIDEPCLALDRTEPELDAFADAWAALASAAEIELCLATYFAGLSIGATLERVLALPVAEVHLDLVRAPEQLEPALARLADSSARLSLGVLDGRNVWAADLDLALDRIDAATDALGSDRVTIAPSCSLLHVPYEAARETGIDPEVRAWLAFCAEKLAELRLLGEAAEASGGRRDELLAPARETIRTRRTSARTNDPPCASARRAEPPELRPRLTGERPARPSGSACRCPSCRRRRSARSRRPTRSAPPGATARGPPRRATYERFLEGEIARVVEVQERLGLDVLVHGEPERNDMVEYFGEQLDGLRVHAARLGAVIRHALRQAADPLRRRLAPGADDGALVAGRPVAHRPADEGDAHRARSRSSSGRSCATTSRARRPAARSRWRSATRWSTSKPPGIRVIQIDEAALREGLPLRRADQDDYLRWAVDCFRLTVAPVRDDDPDPHAHVLLGVQRHHGVDRRARRRRHLDRGVALGHGAARRLRWRARLPERDRARACTTSTPRGCRRPTRSSGCSSWPRRASAATGSGSTPTAG